MVRRELLEVRRIVFFTCSCGIFPTSSRSPVRYLRDLWASLPCDVAAQACWLLSLAARESNERGPAVQPRGTQYHVLNGSSQARFECPD